MQNVVDDFLLRCRVSGIGFVSVLVSNMLTFYGSELFPVCTYFFGVSGKYSQSKCELEENSGRVLRGNRFPQELVGQSCFQFAVAVVTSMTWGLNFCCVAQAVVLDLCRCLSATCCHWMGQSCFQCAFACQCL